ncbi:MAG: hypothetical protein JRI84_13550 [Deltaproteobacteria bacterium]|nr:hypothetical protein [Deltaproteobacteria bacterium]
MWTADTLMDAGLKNGDLTKLSLILSIIFSYLPLKMMAIWSLRRHPMKHTSVFGLSLLLFFFPIYGSITYPQLALGGSYECVVIVTNQKGLPWEGIGLLKQGLGLPWSGHFTVNSFLPTKTGEFSIKLASFGTKKFVLRGDSILRTGYLEIHGDSFYSTEDLTVSFFYNYRQDDRLSDSTGTPPGILDRIFSLPVETGAAINTGIAWAPKEGFYPESMLFKLLNTEGIEVGQATIPFEGHTAKFVTEIFSIPDNFVGSVRIESEKAFYLTGIRLENAPSGFQLTSTPPEGLSFDKGINLEIEKDTFWVRGSTITGSIFNHGVEDAVWTQVVIRAFDANNRFLGGDSVYIEGQNMNIGNSSSNTCLGVGQRGYFYTYYNIDEPIDHWEAIAFSDVRKTKKLLGNISIDSYEVINNSGKISIQGEIINTGTVTVKHVTLNIILLDDLNRVISIELNFPKKRELDPQEKTTFLEETYESYSLIKDVVFLPEWDDVDTKTNEAFSSQWFRQTVSRKVVFEVGQK